MLIDSHCHLTDSDFKRDQAEVLQRAQAMGVERVVCVGFDLASSLEVEALARQYSKVYAVIGVHPHDARLVREQTYVILKRTAQSPRVVAIGETGLDYYRNLSPREAQQQAFRGHIRLARELGLPLVIHDREAHADVLRIMREEKVNEVGGVVHCFSGSWEMAQECMDMGFYISLAGPVTYNNARRLQEIATRVPLDRLLVETDAPYLTPVPLRGKRNEPGYVRYVAEKIADLREITLEELARATTANVEKIFYRMATSTS
ncbi:MAG: TatD family hydrolase [Syntrophomonadaceae bacterium]|nr:TatD family hydrolase [Syntrophomonadaceae bacterium]